jgi:hypothetical protein
VLEELSRRHTAEFGRGFDACNLRYVRQFFLAFPGEKLNALRSKSLNDKKREAPGLESGPSDGLPALHPELSWTHYRLLLGAKIQQHYQSRAPIEGRFRSGYWVESLHRSDAGRIGVEVNVLKG